MSRLDWSRDGARWPNSAHSRFVEAGGLRWHVQIMGEGPVALLLHGTGASTHSWRAFAPALARRFTVVAPDLPGHAFTGRPADMSLPGMAGLVGELVEKLELSLDVLVGHSAGAAVALRLQLDGKTAASAIYGIGGALLPFPGAAAALFPAMARLLFANPLVPEIFAAGARLGGGADGFLKRSTGSTIDREGAALYGRLFGDSRHVGSALAMMAGWDLVPLARDLPQLSTPLVLLHGTRDAAVPSSVSTEVAGLVRDGRVELLTGLGHLPHEEQPEGIAARIVLPAPSVKEAAA